MAHGAAGGWSGSCWLMQKGYLRCVCVCEVSALSWKEEKHVYISFIVQKAMSSFFFVVFGNNPAGLGGSASVTGDV